MLHQHCKSVRTRYLKHWKKPWHIRCHCAGMNMPQTCQHNYNITVILCHPNAPQKHSATCHSNGRLQKPSSSFILSNTESRKVVLCLCRKLPWLEPVFVYQVIEVRDMPGICVTFLDLHSSDLDVYTIPFMSLQVRVTVSASWAFSPRLQCCLTIWSLQKPKR